MDGFEFIATMTGHLAWPGLVAYALYSFRQPIAALIPYVETFEGGPKGITLKINRRIAIVAKEITQIPEQLPPPEALPAPSTLPPITGYVNATDGADTVSATGTVGYVPEEHLLDLAEKNPNEAIGKAWENVAAALLSYANRRAPYDPKDGMDEGPFRAFKVLPEVVKKVVYELDGVRKSVSRYGPFAPPVNAKSYVESAYKLIQTLDAS